MKSHVAPHFDCLQLRNSLVAFMMPSTSCDDNTNANGITWWKMPCCISFQLPWPKKFGAAIYDAVSIMWHWCQWPDMKKKDIIQLISIIMTYEI